jgi:hypothetical protein
MGEWGKLEAHCPSGQGVALTENCIFWLLAAGCWLLAAGCWLLAAGCWLLAAGFTPPSAAQVAQAMFADVGWDDGITVLAACCGDEASWESPAWGHGAFTRAILASAEDKAARSAPRSGPA